MLLTVLAERRLRAGGSAELRLLFHDLLDPPIEQIGEMTLDDFYPRNARRDLAASLNAIMASTRFASWRCGADLDVGAWLTPTPEEPRTPCVCVSVAHLEDRERAMVLGMVLEATLGFVRSLPGTQSLRALVVLDEAYGFLPPHPHDPPTKRPLVTLLKQGRAFGVGVVIATQNPMDLDYRALGNAGLWCIGRLQTGADRARLLEGLAQAGGLEDQNRKQLDQRIRGLTDRWFLLRDAHAQPPLHLLRPRQTIALLRGPLSRASLGELHLAHAARARMHSAER